MSNYSFWSKGKLWLSVRLWISFLCFLFAFNSYSQTDNLTKCACIDSLIYIDNQLTATYLRRNDEVSESDQKANSRQFIQLLQDMEKINHACQSQLTTEKACGNEIELRERREEIQLILRVIEMNRRYFDE